MRSLLVLLGLILCALAGAGGSAYAQADPQSRLRTLADASAAADRGDYERAARLLQPYADQGDAVSQNLLGDLYAEGGKDLPKDQSKAFALYSKAAAKGNAAAERHLGVGLRARPGCRSRPGAGPGLVSQGGQQGAIRARNS